MSKQNAKSKEQDVPFYGADPNTDYSSFKPGMLWRITGDPGAGKTTLALQFSFDYARGAKESLRIMTMLDKLNADGSRPTVFASWQHDTGELQKRVRFIAKETADTENEEFRGEDERVSADDLLPSKLFVKGLDSYVLFELSDDGKPPTTTPDFDEFWDAVAKAKPRLVVIDGIIDAAPFLEDKKNIKHVVPVMQTLKKMAVRHKCCVLITLPEDNAFDEDHDEYVEERVKADRRRSIVLGVGEKDLCDSRDEWRDKLRNTKPYDEWLESIDGEANLLRLSKREKRRRSLYNYDGKNIDNIREFVVENYEPETLSFNEPCNIESYYPEDTFFDFYIIMKRFAFRFLG